MQEQSPVKTGATCAVSFMKTMGKHDKQRGAWHVLIDKHKGGVHKSLQSWAVLSAGATGLPSIMTAGQV